MVKGLLNKLLLIVAILACTQTLTFANYIPDSYDGIKQKLVLYKNNHLKVFNGGPVTNSEGGITWTMPVVFENAESSIKSAYEISFVNCSPENAREANVFYIDVTDIDIKLKNSLNESYKIFSRLMKGTYNGNEQSSNPYIVVRRSDVSMAAYPDIYIEALRNDSRDTLTQELSQILEFLTSTYGTNRSYEVIPTPVGTQLAIQTVSDESIDFTPVWVKTPIDGIDQEFLIKPIYLKNDVWGLYYLIATKAEIKTSESVLVRVDSGCMSGQVYGDDSCDCLDQLHAYLKLMLQNTSSVAIHIPAHDGRGFGAAPKAETEIYKKGGKGKIATVEPMDTISAAKFLYQDRKGVYDIRNYKGAAQILKSIGCETITLFTDNRKKLEDLQNAGLKVIRQNTQTHKDSCAHHLQSKKNDPLYFSDEQSNF